MLRKDETKGPSPEPREAEAQTVPSEGAAEIAPGGSVQDQALADAGKRRFLTGAAVAASLPALSTLTAGRARAEDDDDEDDHDRSQLKDGRSRRRLSARIRDRATREERRRRVLKHPTNGDEERFWGSFIGNFSKTLPHQDTARSSRMPIWLS